MHNSVSATPAGSVNGARVSNIGFRLNPADMAAFTDARIAALKAGLELTPDQTEELAGIRAGGA